MSKFKVGQKVFIISNTSGHGYTVNSSKEYTVSNVLPINSGTTFAAAGKTAGAKEKYHLTGCSTTIFYDTDLKAGVMTKAEIENRIKETESDLELLKEMLAYLDETGADEFEETEYKVFKTLSILDKKGVTKVQKAKAIAKLISG